MIGVHSDTREPADQPVLTRLLSQLWWGSVLLLVAMLIPTTTWQSVAYAQPNKPLPKPGADPSEILNRADPEPWEVLTKDQNLSSDSPLVAIKVEGNISIPTASILKLIKCRRGRPADSRMVRDDMRALYDTRWFTEVTPIFRQTDEGTVLVFRVFERPSIENITYVGNKKIKTRYLEGVTGLRKGGAFSTSANRDAVKGIQRYYVEKGYHFATVSLEKGGAEEDREIVFKIDEGAKPVVISRTFKGNEFFSSSLLATKLKTTVRIVPYLGGTFNPTDIDDDVAQLREYYNKLGFFDAKITAKHEFNEDKSKVTAHYEISEGVRYKVGRIEVIGNQVLSSETLRKDFTLNEAEYFDERKLSRDVDGMTKKYGELGRLYAEVNAQTDFRQEPGYVDVRFRIDEGKVYYVRYIDPVINGGGGGSSHTNHTVIRNTMLVAPGDLANKTLIDKSKRRLQGSALFVNDVMSGNAPKINIRPVEEVFPRPGLDAQVLGQAYPEEDEEPAKEPEKKPVSPYFPDPTTLKKARTARFKRLEVPPDETPFKDVQSQVEHRENLRELFDGWSYGKKRKETSEEEVVRAQGSDVNTPQAQSPLFNNSPQGNPFGNPTLNPPPDQPGYVDLIPEVTETQTGRIQFGVGLNSDAGFLGNAVIDESNFDITRFPTSFRDIFNGTAFRGDGQQFRLEAVPGNQVSRYLVSWRDPFFLDTNYSLGTSGFYYTRIFQFWNELRSGGNIKLGKQFDNFTSGYFTLRLEDVDLYGPPNNPPALLTQSLGHSLLSTARFSMTHDTRDNAFLPTEGHYLEGGYEQAFGQFTYPRFDIIAKQYHTLYQRPDGEGRHIFALTGQFSYTGHDTPIFERLFAGGITTFRGFQFRGVTPVQNGVGIGGQWMAVGSAEYIFPITAGEALRGVVFSDFGTVENTVAFHDFRASLGIGARIVVPAMGPLPIALDLAFPVAKENSDQLRAFNFSVGFLR